MGDGNDEWRSKTWWNLDVWLILSSLVVISVQSGGKEQRIGH